MTQYPATHLLGIPAGMLITPHDMKSQLTVAELRNKIYHDVLEQDGNIKQLEILLVCKQVRAEATGLAFISTQFDVDNLFWPYVVSPLTYNDDIKTHDLPLRLCPFITNIATTIKHRYNPGKLVTLFESGIKPTKSILRIFHWTNAD
jgi:hypothetical protein